MGIGSVASQISEGSTAKHIALHRATQHIHTGVAINTACQQIGTDVGRVVVVCHIVG